jgi:peptidoglycan/xylan/chitin deacetylase (PgdA/CDA1 family)
LNKKIKSVISRLNFALGLNPRVTNGKGEDDAGLIPYPYKAVLLLCADFELAWAWRYAKGIGDQKERAVKMARVARRNIEKILDLCDAYEIPITWATVGHLLLEACERDKLVAHPRIKRVPYHENAYWKFSKGGWYDDDPCTNYKVSPEWYAPDVVRKIIESDVDHEIACHTFSHIDCRDFVCTPDVIDSEIGECRKQAKTFGLEMVSFVHPGHTIGNLDTLRKHGFTSYRTDYRNTLSLPHRHSSGLWELQTTAEIYYRYGWTHRYHVDRLCKIIDRGLRYRRLIYFRFHPSFNEIIVDQVLERVFSYIARLREKGALLVTNTKQYVEYLNTQDCETMHG